MLISDRYLISSRPSTSRLLLRQSLHPWILNFGDPHLSSLDLCSWEDHPLTPYVLYDGDSYAAGTPVNWALHKTGLSIVRLRPTSYAM